MNARYDYLTSVARSTTADDLHVILYDETDGSARYKVKHVDAPVLSGYYYVDDDEISPGRVTRPTRPRRYHSAAKTAIKAHLEEHE